jgi:hypothetical protein
MLCNEEKVGSNICLKCNVLSNDTLLCDPDMIIWHIATFQLGMQEVLYNYNILTVMFYEPSLESVKIHVCFSVWAYGNEGVGYTVMYTYLTSFQKHLF